MTSGFIFFILGLVPLGFIFAFSILEIAIALVQAQVFIILTASYIKDALFLHSDSSKTTGFSGPKKPLNLNLGQRRCYSTKIPRPQKYSNADTQKILILSENDGKSGIYMWTNLITKKCYIGSSDNLKRRFIEYFNVNRLVRDSSMPICRSLLKRGFSKFSLEILEYCKVEDLMEKEKFYFELFKPEYNILKEPGSPAKVGRVFSEEHKANIRASRKNISEETLARMSAGQKTGQKIEVTDLETDSTTIYHTVRAAARALKIDYKYILNYFYLNQDKPVLGRYIFQKLEVPGFAY